MRGIGPSRAEKETQMKITRREMIQGMAAATAVATMMPGNLLAANEDAVAFQGDGPTATKKVIEALGGMKKFVSKGDKVVIKPNMGWASAPAQGANTDPLIVKTLVEMALNAGAKSVLIVDNPVQQLAQCKERNGYDEVFKKMSDVAVRLVRDDKFFVEVNLPKARQLKTAMVIRELIECDTLINAPIAKSHGSALVTFSMKNWMGAVQNRGAFHHDFDLHQSIADFSTFIKPKLIILDATRVMTTKGPAGPGDVKLMYRVYGGTDPVAVDSIAVTLTPWNGKELKAADVGYIRLAAEMGVGRIRTAELPVWSAMA
jgi:uncharacterized protein (DUF362 family)